MTAQQECSQFPLVEMECTTSLPFLLVDEREFGYFDIELNGGVICTIEAENRGSTNYGSASCSAVIRVNAGDRVRVQFDFGSDNTPLIEANIFH